MSPAVAVARKPAFPISHASVTPVYAMPPAPQFNRRAFPPLPADPLAPAHFDLVRGTAPHVLNSFPFEEVMQRYGEEFASTEVVSLHFEGWEVDALWARARATVEEGEEEMRGEKVTRQDALSAYLVTLQNRCSGELPIHTVQNLMNDRLRHPPAPSEPHLLHRHPNAAGNCTMIPNIPLHSKRNNADLTGDEKGAWFSESLYDVAEGEAAWPARADEPGSSTSAEPQASEQEITKTALTEGASPLTPYTSLPLIARAIRRGTRLARADNWVERYLRVNSARYKEGSRRGRFYMYPASGVVLVNSLMGVDRGAAVHFGFPGRAQYYTDVAWERMYRVHPANPMRRALTHVDPARPGEVQWQWQDAHGAVVVCFRAKKGVRDRMERAKAWDVEEMKAGVAW
ncbi:hypothetical protein FA95DRAFT_1563495 [Auriscalpium vulgare]|uniref:Uncharacterized protein n=1 Tax=Auriscalpium vulgare TaxID=40419 RepID=A0ACB8RGM9_9AGAM|nr:hypothetical protein FA95DRAFT_1563495 [Auriscalpium vulgare]